ncbi:MAG: SDR family NAD(P)-dependent oxidoreductase [Geminicoccaceae bacterium]
MSATILITGATDGIGLLTAERLAADGHHMLLHGRNPDKLEVARERVAACGGGRAVETFLADLSRIGEVDALADAVTAAHDRIDVLINNAGIFRTDAPITPEGVDVRFAVNTIAPCALTRRLLPLFGAGGRIVNLSSAAQAPVDVRAMAGDIRLEAMEAYAQSKLALTVWSRELAAELGPGGPAVIAVNPGSLLASKMVREGFGMAGKDLSIGADILVRAAIGGDFEGASGRYFDNDRGTFAEPHPDALDPRKSREIMRGLDRIVSRPRAQ